VGAQYIRPFFVLHDDRPQSDIYMRGHEKLICSQDSFLRQLFAGFFYGHSHSVGKLTTNTRGHSFPSTIFALPAFLPMCVRIIGSCAYGIIACGTSSCSFTGRGPNRFQFQSTLMVFFDVFFVLVHTLKGCFPIYHSTGDTEKAHNKSAAAPRSPKFFVDPNTMMKTRAHAEQRLCDSIVVEGKDLGSQMIEKAPYDDDADAQDEDDDDDDADDDNASTAATTSPPNKYRSAFNEVNEEERKEMLAIEQMASKETSRVDLWRVITTSILVILAVAMTVATFTFLDRENQQNFDTAVSIKERGSPCGGVHVTSTFSH
jgi:hypothetical protein